MASSRKDKSPPPGPEVAESLAHEFVRSMNDLRCSMDSLTQEVRGLREDVQYSTVSGLNQRLDVVIDQMDDLMGTLDQNTNATLGAIQRIDLIQGLSGIVQRVLSLRKRPGPMP